MMKYKKYVFLLAVFAFLILVNKHMRANARNFLYLYHDHDTIIRQVNQQERIVIQDGRFTGIGYQRNDTGALKPKPFKKDNWDEENNGSKRFIIKDNKLSSTGEKTEIEKIKAARKEKEKPGKQKEASDSTGRFKLADGKFIGAGKKTRQ